MFEALVQFLQKAASGCHVKFAVELGKQSVRSVKRTKTKSSMKKSSKPIHSKVKKSSNTNKDSFLKDYAIAFGVAWQVKDLLLSENTRTAMLGSGNLESAYLALKVISEASVLHCLKYEYLSACPISAYSALAMHMALHNIKFDGSSDSPESMLELTVDHLLHCGYNLFKANNHKKSAKFLSELLNTSKLAPGCSTVSEECQTGASLVKQIRISNTIRTLTIVLKFIVDATAMNLAHRYQERCLNFATENLKFIIRILREHSKAQLQYTKEDIKVIFICLKSSFTYGAKILNTVLKTSEVSPTQAGGSLANELFNLIVSVEEFLGYGCAARFITVVQPWIPDLILALGSCYLLQQTPEEGLHSHSSVNVTPSWFYVLARIEFLELIDEGSSEEIERAQNPNHFSAFKRLVGTMSELLKANSKVLDAVGVVFLNGSLHALESKNFDVVLGLLRFVCVKLVRSEDRDWEELKLMLASVAAIYPKVEREAEDLENSMDDRQKLYNAKELLEPVWTCFVYDNQRNSMEED